MAVQQLLPFEGEREETPPRHIEELARMCRERPLEEKVLVVPSLQVGYEILEALARSGQPWVNLRVETVRTLAHAAIGPALARDGWKLLSRAQALALVEQACAETLTTSSYFGSLADRPGLHRSFQRTFDELRAAGLGAESLPETAFADRRKHRELREVLRRYTEALETGRFVDGIEALRRALRAVEAGEATGNSAVYLVAGSTELSSLERAFLEKLAAGRLVSLATDPPGSWKAIAGQALLLRAIGEENEVREVFRAILRERIPFDDVEILHTDSRVYPPLLWELAREHGIPFTLAGGIPVTYTRPGQAALAFLDWIGQGFAAESLRQALASGALTLSRLDGGEEAPGARAVARALREAGVGWGRERHITCLDRLVAELGGSGDRGRRDADASDEQRTQRAQRRSHRLDAARRARVFVHRVLALAPESLEAPGDLRSLARAARTFVSDFARAADELDGTARTALDALFEELEELPPLDLTTMAAAERLRDAVARLAVAADRPRPGSVHAAFFRAGGFSSRRHAFLVGLDERRLPGKDLEDPVLLDEERRRINEASHGVALPLGRERPREAAAAFWACLGRLRGHLSASYSSFDLSSLAQAGEPAPSPAFLDLFRVQSGRPDADYSDLAEALPRAAGFAPSPNAALDDAEWWLSRLRQGSGGGLEAAVCAVYPWLGDGRRAEEARASDEFTAWDGFVSSATPELDPRAGDGAPPFSPSRIQELAACPFSYFVRHVLRVEAPDDIESDPRRWLSPMDEGSLLHEVFRDFFERITAAGEKPERARHLDLILAIAESRIGAWRERLPPRSELAFDLQRENIRFACRILLLLEERHCREATPRHFEVPFGLPKQARAYSSTLASPDPVSIEIAPGRSFRLRGSIDRVDEAPDGTYEIWDYKTGSSWSVREGVGVRGGRQVQPALYAMAFETLLDRAGRPGKVSKSGYLFPGRKGEGQRMAAPIDRRETREVLGKLFDLLAEGMFPHALSPDDCRFCDYTAICGGAKEASERTRRKLAARAGPVLAAFRDLHAEETD
jgi:RecB family exonuclease